METGTAARAQKTGNYERYSLITFLKLSKIPDECGSYY
jgi:hypothetical protein